MFCPQCGKENQEAAAFCIYCGNKLSSMNDTLGDVTVSNNTPQITMLRDTPYAPLDVYRKLGGWLAVLAYGRIISAVVELIICAFISASSMFFQYHGSSKTFVGLANFIKVAGYRGFRGETIFCYGGLLAIFLYIFLVCCSIAMYRKIKARKANCMRFYRCIVVIISCMDIVGLAVGYLLLKMNYDAIILQVNMAQIISIAQVAVWLLLDMIISLLIFSVYFKSSKRVSVYFKAKQ